MPGDVNLDYGLDITDAIAILNQLFLGVEGVLCDAAADFNGDGSVNMGDPVGLLSYLYLGGPAESRDVLCTVTE